MVLTTQGLLVLVVFSAVQGKEEKIKHRAYFTDPGNTWQYSQHFAFDPFTPFPELSKNTPGPTTPTPAQTTPKASTPTPAPAPEPTNPTPGPTNPAPGPTNPARRPTSPTPSRTTQVPFTPTTEQKSNRDTETKCEEENNNRQLQISAREWVQSILRRTTRKLTTTTTTTTTATTTTTPTTTTTKTTTTTEVVLTRELQIELGKLLARRNPQETPTSNSITGNAINQESRNVFFTPKPAFVEGQYSNAKLQSAYPGPNYLQNLYVDSQQQNPVNLYQQRQSFSNQKPNQSKFINQLQSLILQRSTNGFSPSANAQQLPRQTIEQRRKYLFP